MEEREEEDGGEERVRVGDRGLPPVVARLERGDERLPICVLVVGMAGSGKTTLMSQLQRSLQRRSDDDAKKQAGYRSRGDNGNDDENEEEGEDEEEEEDDRYYCLNLDPATVHLPFDCNIDIRDTVDYRQVMRQHRLGPNGAIMTSLNLFATKFDQVLALLERRAYGREERQNQQQEEVGSTEDNNDNIPLPPSDSAGDGPSLPPPPPLEYILVDTPGQIEAFTWSASGSIVCQSLASSFPTVVCFVVDTARCASNPNTFMSNMLYACSILYRTRLPLIVCFNKVDVASHRPCLEWMRDPEAFQDAIDEYQSSVAGSSSSGGGYYGSLTRSLSLVLDEFYSGFAHAVGVSSVTGQGVDEFWEAAKRAARNDFAEYVEDLRDRAEENRARERALARSSVSRLERDLRTEVEE